MGLVAERTDPSAALIVAAGAVHGPLWVRSGGCANRFLCLPMPDLLELAVRDGASCLPCTES